MTLLPTYLRERGLCKHFLISYIVVKFKTRLDFSDNRQPESSAVLAELENIDTQADKMNIAFVKICDLELVDEMGLTQLPSIVYYRQTIPIPYEGIRNNFN